MKRYIFGLVLVAALIVLWPGSGFTQSKEAREVCRRVNPAGAWRKCMRQYDQERNKLPMDPKWQAYQRQRREQRRLQERAWQQQQTRQEEDRKVYDAGECIGPVIMGRCRGTILPNKSYHPTCYGEWIGGRCTGPLF